MNYIITEEQLKFIIENSNENTSQLLDEAWYNTVFDVLGIFDPTGVVDFVNGLSYIKQGDYLFGLLSMVAVIPVVGDIVAKPLIGAGKFTRLGSKVDKALDIAKNAKSKDDLVKVSKILDEASQQNSLLKKFLLSVPRWGDKLKDILLKLENKIPGGKLGSGVRKLIGNWIDIISEFAKRRLATRRATKNLARTAAKTSAADAASIVKKLESMKDAFAKSEKVFTTTKLKDPSFMVKYFWPMFTIRNQTNRELIGLMRRTKFFLGFLDFLGIGNWKGPEEIEKQIGSQNFDKKIAEYSKTKEGMEYWEEDMSALPDNLNAASATPETNNEPSTTKSKYGISDFINTLFGK